MATHDDNFTFDELKAVYEFLGNTKFGKIYVEFSDEKTFDEDGQKHCGEIKESGLTYSNVDEEIQIKFCNNLYKIIVKVNGWNNGIFNGVDKDDKMYCICLKYWLYDKIENSGPKGLHFDDFFEKWQKDIKNKIKDSSSNPCIFNKLTWGENNKITGIYALKLLFLNNIKEFNEKQNVDCKYLNYFGKNFNEYVNSIDKCSKKESEDNYCKEFNKFHNIYKEDCGYFKTSSEAREYEYKVGDTINCSLKIESPKEPLHLSYWNKMQRIHLSDHPFDSLNSSIIPTSSAIGTTVGLSAFLLYLYKYTSFGSLFRTRIQKDNTMFDNIDEGTHSFTMPTSELESTHYENGNYKITYYSLNNS
ncbi:PIR Superfamily Protein [Plasmodium ovale wallikeri]|uniref:PIR Superfamily Protein n=1 Tax=Plasmodium ovale wallikeri TaxID=864142 RepID=A0A1A9A7K7_PLAOA|nr:PIR Superfamily Protein [Plasmodium ovale wallikeri]SBT56580.1 PIR Superfamily Protein [Plasmodium ovale wallikeri]